jgi:predicted nucleotide-binding protein
MLEPDTKALLGELVTHLAADHAAERNEALRQLKLKMAQQGLGASSAFDQAATQLYRDAIEKFGSRVWTEVKQFLEQTRFDPYPDCERDLTRFFDEVLATNAEADYSTLSALKPSHVNVSKSSLAFHYKQVGGKIATEVKILCRKLRAAKEPPQNLPFRNDAAVKPALVSEHGLPKDTRTVFVVHGRNEALRDSMFAFLRAIGLEPLEWSQAVAATSEATPYVGQVLDAAFSIAQAVVVLMTPDDDACLREEFRSTHDPQYEKEPTGQARPNVLFEAGMAMGRDARRTVLVEIGSLRPFSDVAGRHILRLNNSSERRQDFAERLRTAGCPVELTGRNWHSVGSFEVDEPRSALPTDKPGTTGGHALEMEPNDRNPVTALTEAEAEIIMAVPDHGWIYVMRSDAHGQFVNSGDGEFFRPEDASHQAKYLDALDSLLAKRLVRPESPDAYRLTGRGFELRKALKSASASSDKWPSGTTSTG